MIGAIIGDLAAWTWETIMRSFTHPLCMLGMSLF